MTKLVVYAIIGDQADYERKHRAHDACLAAGVIPPEELMAYRNPNGYRVRLDGSGSAHPSCTETDSNYYGFDVNLSLLPPGTTALRFIDEL